MKNFLVYKSSAGSGKTTTLVNEYLKITLKTPGEFRHVLAITFTNKAANELKNRILEILQSLISGTLNNGLEAVLTEGTGLSSAELQNRAGRLLSLILHHYDEFAVSTIDSFVHQLVRSFATDLKLPQGFEVLIEDDDLIPFILETLYQQVGNNPSLTQILTRYVLSQIEEEKAYDPTEKLTGFIKKQLKEDGFDEVKKLEAVSSQNFIEIISQLQKAIQGLKSKMQELSREAIDLIYNAGLEVKDLYQSNKGVAGYFNKIQNGSAFEKPDGLKLGKHVQDTLGEDKWYKASAFPSVKSAIDGIKSRLSDIVLLLIEMGEKYTKRSLVYQNIYELALVSEIQRIFKSFIEQTQKVHISEFNKRIHEEIANQPVPFIYERIGNRYHHFLIDEFQDTSVLQWKNLLPLLEESLANGNFNMVVGDAKQAIYRFRNGEMELFSRLPELYPPAQNSEDLQRQRVLSLQYNEQQLKINYRSKEEIVYFNNRFFAAAAQQIGQGFASVYGGHQQDLPPKKKEGGWVSIEFLEYLKKEEIQFNRLASIESKINELSEANYPLKDICILTRTNNTGLEIAAHLLSKGFPVVSSDSLKLSASPSVRMIVAFLQLISNGSNELALTEFIGAYVLYFKCSDKLTTLFLEARTEQDYLAWVRKKLAIELPSRSKLYQYSVFEMVVEGIRHLIHPVHDDLFLQFFLDFVQEKNSLYHSLEEFLTLWEEKSRSLSIVMPEGLDAIQVMTAHKAKGLKFGVVIADLYQYKNDLTQDQLWESVDFPETEKLDKALLKVSKNLDLIGLGEVYDRESAKSKLDFLNLVYVAFTRPVDGLHIICHWRETMSDQFSKMVKLALEAMGTWKDGALWYNFGSMEISSGSEMKKVKDNLPEDLNFKTGIWYEHMTIAPVEETYWEALGKKSPRVYGNLVHEMLSKIHYADDALKILEAYKSSGMIDDAEAGQINQMLKNVTNHPEVVPYFTKGVQVKTETELVDKVNNKVMRPDRVVLTDNKLVLIDYKTGEKKPVHRKQMENYAAFFSEMGYQNIEKLLVYINNEVEVIFA